MALGKCPPLSQVLTHFPEMWAALSPAGHPSSRQHTVALLVSDILHLEPTLWTNHGAFLEHLFSGAGVVHFFVPPWKPAAIFDQICRRGES